jgi:DNA helicase-2/ATP-dependent DNA helicase PcrA
MSDEAVAQLLRSSSPLILVEASAGCGKTYQGAAYAKDIAATLGQGRLLILTHTHAACGVFADRTKAEGTHVEIKTIDALVGQIATAYHKSLGLPASLSTWAWQNDGAGFEIMAAKVAAFLIAQPMVARALARRYPVIICDEHQDSTEDQHSVVMALHAGGALLRIFGDPMQRIYGQKSDKAALADQKRWEALKQSAAFDRLDHPHRWKDGCPDLGGWILNARAALESGKPIDLTAERPRSVKLFAADNIAQSRDMFQLSAQHRKPIDAHVREQTQLMILASHNPLVAALRAFWGRSIPIWEGHTRNALATLVNVTHEKSGDADALVGALMTFVGDIAVGFSSSSHGNRLVQEVKEGCTRQTTGKPANIQAMARAIIEQPSHVGVATALDIMQNLVETKGAGFDQIKIDHRTELRDAIRLGQFAEAQEGFAEITRKRSYVRPSPPARVLSSIHKAKGLECDNAMIVGCDKAQFSGTLYARCRMYVAISRARKSLTLVVPTANTSPLFKTS